MRGWKRASDSAWPCPAEHHGAGKFAVILAWTLPPPPPPLRVRPPPPPPRPLPWPQVGPPGTWLGSQMSVVVLWPLLVLDRHGWRSQVKCARQLLWLRDLSTSGRVFLCPASLVCREKFSEEYRGHQVSYVCSNLLTVRAVLEKK